MPTTGDMQEPRATVSRPPEDDAPHLLLVDDDTRIRTLLRRFLSENGFRITAAATSWLQSHTGHLLPGWVEGVC